MATFGRYEIIEKLGEGAMGVVYRARHTVLGRNVALKMLSAELGVDEELHKRFQREAQAIGRLNHPNIVTVYDVGESEGQLYMAMELLDGDDLRNLLERHTDVGLADRVRILAQISEGLGYAHSKGVVHRDVKPANILVTSAGKVKILDFGLARVTTGDTITKRGVILGTPDYMSPEQATGRPIDKRTDIFSAGAVFYEFLTQRKPFRGKTLHAVLYQIISDDPDPVLALNPDLPARLAAVVHRMLEKDPDTRYGSMEEVGRDLQEIYRALRLSRSHSALPREKPPASEEHASRLKESLAQGRAHFEAERFAKAASSMTVALSLDPENEEAEEIIWRSSRRLQAGRSTVPSPDISPRIKALLDKVSKGLPDNETKQILAELALIAPDDPQVVEILKEMAPKGPPRGFHGS